MVYAGAHLLQVPKWPHKFQAEAELEDELGSPACLPRGLGPAAWPLENRPPKSMRGTD